MPKDGVKDAPGPRRKLTESGVKLILGMAATAAVGVVIAMPKPVPPVEPPSLVLDRGRVEEIVRADGELAGEAPDGQLAQRVMRLYREQGRGEASDGEPAGAATRRLAELRAAVRELTSEHGQQARWALRARAVSRAMELLGQDGDDAADGRDEWLGKFDDMLAKYGLVRAGERVAPDFVVRTLYKARWSSITGAALTKELEPLERQAYWGWLALHATDVNVAMRWKALDRYEEAGGPRVAEARGALAWQAGRYAEAGEHFRAAHTDNPTFRLRNHRLSAVAGQ